MPSARFWAKSHPEEDFAETVKKTADLLYRAGASRSSCSSAPCRPAASWTRYTDAIRPPRKNCAPSAKNLIVRFGPMYGAGLKRGVLIDMLEGKKVFVDGASRYCFSPVSFGASWIAANLHRSGTAGSRRPQRAGTPGGRGSSRREGGNLQGAVDHCRRKSRSRAAISRTPGDVFAFLEERRRSSGRQAASPMPEPISELHRVCGNAALTPCGEPGLSNTSRRFSRRPSIIEVSACRACPWTSCCAATRKAARPRAASSRLAHRIDLRARCTTLILTPAPRTPPCPASSRTWPTAPGG